MVGGLVDGGQSIREICCPLNGVSTRSQASLKNWDAEIKIRECEMGCQSSSRIYDNKIELKAMLYSIDGNVMFSSGKWLLLRLVEDVQWDYVLYLLQ